MSGGVEKEVAIDSVAMSAQTQVPIVPSAILENISDSGDDASHSGSESNGEPKTSGFGQKEDDDELPSSNSSGSDERHDIDYIAVK